MSSFGYKVPSNASTNLEFKCSIYVIDYLLVYTLKMNKLISEELIN